MFKHDTSWREIIYFIVSPMESTISEIVDHE